MGSGLLSGKPHPHLSLGFPLVLVQSDGQGPVRWSDSIIGPVLDLHGWWQMAAAFQCVLHLLTGYPLGSCHSGKCQRKLFREMFSMVAVYGD